MDQEYYSTEELTPAKQKEFIDPLLYRMVSWLSSNDNYANATAVNNEKHETKVIAIASDITSLVSSVNSPKHLGLSVHLYNEFGSRHLVEDMSNLGYGISYSELRMFLSSAAEHVIQTQRITKSGGLVPENISHINDGGQYIVGVADNWDHNEKTVDGKRTTHAMTSILVAPNVDVDMPLPRLPRSPNRSFDKAAFPGGSLYHITAYKKPTSRPCPHFDPPVTKKEVKPIECMSVKAAKMKELLFNFGRCSVFCEDQAENSLGRFQPWDTFQASVMQDTPSISNVAYNPIIMATPTDYSTVYTVLLRLKECMNELGQGYAPVVFDMSLLSKALEIVWCQKEELQGIIPCEGGMHMLMSVFAGIGHIYGDAGLFQLLSESGVYSSVTASNILAGKDFDRGLTAFKLIDEVLHTRLLINFESWCIDNERDFDEEVITSLLQLKDQTEVTDTEIETWCEAASNNMFSLLEEFRKESRNISPTFRLWDDYLRRISVPLKLFISSTRSPNWNIHKYAKLCLLPFLFASNRTTYAKYITVQVLQMNRLPEDVEEGFQKGMFTAKLSSGKFNSVWLDYTLEVTENKALKGAGGIIGLTLKEGALTRWFLSRPISSRYSADFHKSLCSEKDQQHKHHTDSKAKREQYNRSVAKMASSFDANFIDPFNTRKTPPRLVNFATCIQATEEVEKSMLDYLDKGEELMNKFISERLIVKPDGTDPPLKSFHSPMTRNKILTMTEPKKRTQTKQQLKTISSEVMFQRLLAVNSYKKVSQERVFAYENTAVPTSMFSEDGSMLKCKKSDFMQMLENLLQDQTTSIRNVDTLLLDAMASVQAMTPPSENLTFDDVANNFLKFVLMKAHSIEGVKSLHLIFDRYDPESLKSQTRLQRGDVSSSATLHIHGQLRLPKNWKAFISIGKNKESLIQYFTEYIIKHAALHINDAETIYISGNHKCFKVVKTSCEEVPELNSNQEEADSRIILHAAFAKSKGVRSVAVSSPDTDVLVLLLHHCQTIGIEELFFVTGRTGVHTDTKRYISVHHLYNMLTEEQHNIILPVYCLSGCDTTSSFYGKGKKKAFKLLIQNASKYQGLKDMGEEALFTQSQKQACTSFVADLYGSSECTSLNALRCSKALQSLSPRYLPPSENSFVLHCLRCVLQLYIWRNATIAVQHLPPPSQFGYKKTDAGVLEPITMSQSVAAPELLKDVVCSCIICNELCSCFKNQIPCTSACVCIGCTNDSEDRPMCTNIFTMTSLYNETSEDNIMK
ncbi:uncharacterized protein LOC132736731 [Ruditapes philippinarum]|uniref:uncharacterized protein LOC132736731 n=1 Tax=Ruditapes philippinarum TaxID=129788 RepID=UPI00295B7D78|nr:uncharacterized protein LOC132736731 [Ruditapes philippinarum]